LDTEEKIGDRRQGGAFAGLIASENDVQLRIGAKVQPFSGEWAVAVEMQGQ
jgi:hypothetical protein